MPTDTNVHKKNKKKNFVVLAIIVFFIALIWAMTMVKIAKAETMDERSTGTIGLFSKEKTDPKYPFGDSPTVFTPQVAEQAEEEPKLEADADIAPAVQQQPEAISMDEFRDRIRNKGASAPVPTTIAVAPASANSTAPLTLNAPDVPSMPAAPVAPVRAQVPQMAYGARPGEAPKASAMAAPSFASSNDPYLPEGQYPSFIIDARNVKTAPQPQPVVPIQNYQTAPMPLAVPVQSEMITTTTTKVTTFEDNVINTRKDYGKRRNAPARYAGTEIMTEETTDVFAAPKAPVINARQPAAFSRRSQTSVISRPE